MRIHNIPTRTAISGPYRTIRRRRGCPVFTRLLYLGSAAAAAWLVVKTIEFVRQ